jgi:hypothetical protein
MVRMVRNAVMAVLIAAIFPACGAASLSSHNPSGNSISASGTGLYAGQMGELVGAEAYGIRERTGAEVRSLDTASRGHALRDTAAYNREMSLTDLQSICTAQLPGAEPNREQRYRCRRVQEQQFLIEVLERGVWMPITFPFGFGALGMTGMATGIYSFQQSGGANYASGTSPDVRQAFDQMRGDLGKIKARQKVVESVVERNNAAVDSLAAGRR